MAAIIAATLAVPPMLFPLASSDAQAQSRPHEITITVSRVRAVDRLDIFSRADFFARSTIGTDAQNTPFVRQQNDIRPNWRLVHQVPAGRHDVGLELFDRDLTKNDPVDINRVANKRRLDFTIDTRTCRITGLTGISRCKNTIVRAGAEPKSAEVTFTVDVRR
jgi:hypothetical protein